MNTTFLFVVELRLTVTDISQLCSPLGTLKVSCWQESVQVQEPLGKKSCFVLLHFHLQTHKTQKLPTDIFWIVGLQAIRDAHDISFVYQIHKTDRRTINSSLIKSKDLRHFGLVARCKQHVVSEANINLPAWTCQTTDEVVEIEFAEFWNHTRNFVLDIDICSGLQAMGRGVRCYLSIDVFKVREQNRVLPMTGK
jgi:hypothetical protein